MTTNGPLAAPALLHPAVEDRRPERGDLLQRRQRWPDARSAQRHRRRLPRADAARRAAGDRPRRPASLPVSTRRSGADTPSGPGWHRYNGDGYGDGATDGQPWAPTGAGTGHLWPVLSAERGEQQLQTRRRGRRGRAARRHGALRLRRRPDPRAGLGAARPGGIAVRHRPDARVDRLRERRAGGLGGAADLVGRLVRPARARHRRRALVDRPRATRRPLRRPHARARRR